MRGQHPQSEHLSRTVSFILQETHVVQVVYRTKEDGSPSFPVIVKYTFARSLISISSKGQLSSIQ